MYPSHIDRYEIVSEIGRGGMGVVYLAYDPQIDRQVAIKLLPSQFLFEKKYKVRLQREARIIARLEHPAIVPIYDFGQANEQPYLVMRYMAGGSLVEWLRHGHLPVATAVSITKRLASALYEAHRQGIVHRDLKPSNILLDNRGNTYLSDFGIVKVLDATFSLTGSTIVGTPAYMSPEQIRTPDALDHRADIYALGVVLFEMLTGKRPFSGATYPELILAHTTEPIPHICEFNPELPPDTEHIIRRTMAKKPNDRYASVNDLIAQLEAITNPVATSANQIISSTKPTLTELPAAKSPFPRWLTAFGLILLLTFTFTIGPRFLPSVSGNEETATTSPFSQVASTLFTTPVATTHPPAADLPKPETAIATHTPTPQLNATTAQTLTYQIISIQNSSDLAEPEANLGLAPGATTLLGIPFEHGWKASTQCANSPNRPEVVEIPVDDLMVTKLHILLQGGQGFIKFDEQKIGEIVLSFANGETFEEPLILGHNIRDWRRNQSELYVDSSTAFNLREAWSEKTGNTDARIDLLTLPLPSSLQTTPLDSIHIVDTSVQTTNSPDPCIHLIAITAETRPGN